MTDAKTRMPTLYIPHGGGPCFFMDWTMGPADTWARMADYLRGIGRGLPAEPKALLVVSAHWEEALPTVIDGEHPPLLYDYYGFPPHTYQLTWPAPGSPTVAARVRELLGAAGIESARNGERGLDHGVFVPLKLTYEDAHIPTVQLSLQQRLEPRAHLALGRALAPLRDEGVFIVGSGSSFHNMAVFRGGPVGPGADAFDAWLGETAELDGAAREARLADWEQAPGARECHPREEHLLPLMVAAGAASGDAGRRVFHDRVMGAPMSALQFG